MNVTTEHKICYHCGNECEEEIIPLEEKSFCCTGCKTVYEILSENDLCSYYDIEKNPGISFKRKKSDKYEFLDEEQIQQKLFDFYDSKIARITLYLPQIHCYSCLWLLEKLYVLDKGITESKVNYLKKEIHLSFKKEETTLRKVVELLDQLGYAPKIQLDSAEKKRVSLVDQSLYLKIGVSGFIFGNVMLLSFPEYISESFQHSEFAPFFSYVSLLLGLPILFFSAVDYLKSAWFAFKSRTMNMDVPISFGAITIYLSSIYQVMVLGNQGYVDSLAALIFFLLLGKLFQQKTFDHLSFERDYRSYFPLAVTELTPSGEKAISFDKIKVGQRLLIRNEELIPADAYLMSHSALIDFSFVTGESEPVEKHAGEIIHAGGRIKGNAVEVEVAKDPSQSYLTGLWNNHLSKEEKQDSFDGMTNKISKYFTISVVSIAVMSGLFWYPIDPQRALWALVSVKIVACPCALALAAPLALGNALRLLGKHKFFVKNTLVLERIARLKQLIFDKTGTLTNLETAQIQFVSTIVLNENQRVAIKSLLRNSGHPLSKRISKEFSEKTTKIDQYQEVSGAGVIGVVNGISYKIGSSSFVTGEKHEEGGTRVYIAENGNLLGYYKIENSLRPDMPLLIESLKSEYQLCVLSGDSPVDKSLIEDTFGTNTPIYFNQSPFDKMSFVENENRRLATAMVGDGLNDSGALKKAEVGIAVTEDISLFTPSSDVIMEGKDLHRLNRFLDFGKAAKKVVIVAFVISLFYNVVGLFFAVQGTLSPVIVALLMPISSISVVLYTMLSTNYLERKYLRGN